MKKNFFLPFVLSLVLPSCGTVPLPPPTPDVTLQGTIIENPSHLTDQSEYLLVNSDTNTLLAYLTSNQLSLSDFIDQNGAIVGKVQTSRTNDIPLISVDAFNAPQAISLEDILFSTIKREAKKAPYNKAWKQNVSMVVLQSDNSSGSAQVQVVSDGQNFIVKLVKNQDSWHIADIESKGYSTVETSPTSSTGSSFH